jgi:hypothetical protein
MEYEMTVIPYVSHGLEVLRENDETSIPAPENPLARKALDITRLRKIIETEES